MPSTPDTAADASSGGSATSGRSIVNSLPLFESAYPGPHPERCHIAYEVLRYIEAFVESNGYTPRRLRSLSNERAPQAA